MDTNCKIMLWEILVPTMAIAVDAKGRIVPDKINPIRKKYHRLWDMFVRNLSNGLTIMRPAKGQWISDTNKLYEERMIPVRIACSEEQIKKIGEFTKKHYRQEKVMYFKISEEVYIV